MLNRGALILREPFLRSSLDIERDHLSQRYPLGRRTSPRRSQNLLGVMTSVTSEGGARLPFAAGWEALILSHSVRSFASGLRETPVGPSASFQQLTWDPNSRQSLVVGYKTPACAEPCPRPLRSGDRCLSPPLQFSAGIAKIFHARQEFSNLHEY